MTMRAVIHSTIAPPPIPCKAQNSVSAQPANRRATLGGLLLFATVAPLTSASPAFSFGISGPKEWLKEQKRKTSKFVLAPIEASRLGLNNAYKLLTSENLENLEDVKGIISAATRDCVPDQRNSIVAFQSRTGVEVCTFSLILKNAASLLDDKDPIKLEAENSLNNLVRSFSDIGSTIETSNFELPSDRKKMGDGLMETISALDKFQEGVRSCLGI